MNTPDTTLEIQTLGTFNIYADGKPVAIEWPDETIKVLFCSLLSPLDLFFTWDRICRTMLGAPETQTNRRRLDKSIIRPLKSFLTRQFGFNPLIAGQEGIRINQQRMHVDVFEFYYTFLEGLRQLALSNNVIARENFSRANLIYAGGYLPGMSGKIIDHTRIELESLYRSAVMDDFRHAHTTVTPKQPTIYDGYAKPDGLC
jgi:hypothetical protein